MVAAGGNHTCALTGTGAVYCWGATKISGKIVMPPAVQVVSGFKHSCALLTTGEVVCWGANHFGQLGNAAKRVSPVPMKVDGLGAKAQAIYAGGDHTCAALADGSLKCWGVNASGELGSSPMKQCRESANGASLPCTATPVEIKGLDGTVSSFSIGFSHACAVVGGGVKCWGGNSHGQLGDGSTTSRPTPAPVALTSRAKIVAVGDKFSCAALDTGAVSCWGRETKGRIAPVAGLGGPVTALSAGFGLACAVVSGKAQCWGNNFLGRLGNGSTRTGSRNAVYVGPWR
jgi:alpha-tubulin suppressor-like RCC1 family protein